MTSSGLRASIIIPAHDEERTLDRLLVQIAELADDHEVIVVANGCSDATAEVARTHGWCRVIVLDTASKFGALNAGDEAARSFPRIYLDADVSMSATAVRSLVTTLDTPAARLASPPVRIDDRDASVLARAYQHIWALTDYRLHDHTGSGVFGLSTAGRARFDAFPDLISDDLYVRRLFTPQERFVAGSTPFTIHAPRTVRAQIHRLARTMAGELQLARRFPELVEERTGSARGRLLQRVARRPGLWPAFVVYAGIYAAGRASARRKIARGRVDVWERDVTTR